ncbi:MutS-related protein [Adhaeribacter soli]|uniref:DNA mismatch repair protein MutS n=1 Tax=Adhaeribacter soli TaxID=2607655 RepID=A0A5N1IUW0_9BACT|nr:DNA mismatch repair protein MutS [Adhaeribacter soli]KAA9333721.1 DNA mismatch repair protein MutS [Adhaeribacter soli]
MNHSEISTPETTFKKRQHDFASLENTFRRKANQISLVRLSVFLTGAALAGWCFYTGNDAWGFLVIMVFYLGFGFLVRLHSRLQYQQEHNRILSLINAEEISRLQGKLSIFDDGSRYKDNQHYYTSDLDVFGSHSLYGLVSRAVTVSGKNTLARWLQQAAAKPEILARQEAVQEILPELEWRQQLEAKARHYKRKTDHLPDFLNWLAQPGFFAQRKWLLGLTFLLPLVTISAIGLWYFDLLSGYVAGALAFVQYLFHATFKKAKDEIQDKSEDLHKEVAGYVSALEHIENREFSSAKLRQVQARLYLNQVPASASIKRLATILDYLSATQNVYLNLLVNSLLMWDFFWLWQLDNWKQKSAPLFEPAVLTLAEVECLASFAAFQYANPGYAVPEISDEPFEISTSELGHPLIFVSERITNSFTTSGAGKSLIITGSNMSGKSTFLRTVGLNMVLAYAGSAVCAQRFKAYPMQVFTAMRTEDNLAESTSSFYAELKRLKMLLDLTEKPEPVFYFLDEILKGTNSKDRHLGAVALVKQLHQRQASGMVSTHDLELGNLENEMPGSVKNYSFNSRIEGDKIIFDYKLTPGVCGSFNASKLMQLMGIAIEEA